MAPTRRDIASMILRCGPSAAALGYPLALVLLHQSGRQFAQATDAIGTLLAGFAVCVTVALVYSVPVFSFAVILESGGQIHTRRLAHLAFAAPPLFTVIGVVFFFLGIPNGDYVVWAVAWLGVLAYTASASPQETAPAPPATWVRTAHGVTGATILSCSRSCLHCSYGNWRPERVCVFILGRWFLGVDTTFEWASGAPSGLLRDAWNVRLIPHYSLAVLFVIGHFAMGLRAVLVGHGVRVALADRASWTICSIGLALSFVIAVAQLGVGA